MKRLRRIAVRILERIAPAATENRRYVARARKNSGDVIGRMAKFEEDLAALAAELNEIRRDERRMAELYDLVFERMRAENPVETVADPQREGD